MVKHWGKKTIFRKPFPQDNVKCLEYLGWEYFFLLLRLLNALYHVNTSTVIDTYKSTGPCTVYNMLSHVLTCVMENKVLMC